ncbi:MAG: hypothetical protein IPL35_05610 [Sphingobacteriales bacterium]|nr:hypothetical protein [Sphingobacteriales bacterium]
MEAVAASVWNIFKNPRRLRVFISREVDDTGYFAQQMRATTSTGGTVFGDVPRFAGCRNARLRLGVFTSSKGVEFLRRKQNTTLPPTLKWAALGAGTAATLRPDFAHRS